MVKIIPTKDVFHKVNNDYTCVLIQFEPGDSHFFRERMNWMPKHGEIREYLREIMKAEPKGKREILADFLIEGLVEGMKEANAREQGE